VPGNMFVPIDLLSPILPELIARGRSSLSDRAWMGVNCVEAASRVRVVRVTEDSPADVATLQSFIVGTDKALSSLTDSASILGATKQRVTLQSDFVTTLMNVLERGISTLVDADMTEESTRLQALQVQQQLGTQSLSIANQSSQNILALFRS